MKKLVLALSIVALVAACGKSKTENIKYTKWQLMELPGKQFDYNAVSGDNYRVEFTSNAMGGHRIEGKGDCNEFKIETTIYPELRSISNGYLKIAREKCSNIEQEQMFLDVLKDVDFYQINGDVMELYDGRLMTMKLKRIKKTNQ